MRQALADPLNQRFVLLSETCVPLYPAPLVWAQLQGETRSRVNACANGSNPDDENWRMTYRCHLLFQWPDHYPLALSATSQSPDGMYSAWMCWPDVDLL